MNIKDLLVERERITKLILDQVFKSIKDKMVESFPQYRVSIHCSVDDFSMICVNVFSVEKEDYKRVNDFIRNLERELFPDMEFILLPMSKDIETTKKYYPEYL